ncbi:MAG: DUF444 family protein [Acidobacteria bacterium]|nr:DUF444 family protein [Acidobacteriota bacterium]MBI3656047.1 DUF444 family protein [Acidobacteriota bacterium]
MKMQQIPWDLRRRGLKDSIRHDKRVKDAIRKNLKELIAEENIITSDGKKLVKIPLKYLDQYRFRYGTPGNATGQGKGQPGDVIARDSANAPGMGPPGDNPGGDIYEAEISLEELTNMMLADLALPWFEDKKTHQIKTTTYRYDEIRTKGPMSNIDKRRTLLENIKRNAAKSEPKVADLCEEDLRFRVWSVKEELQANACVYLLMDRSGSMTTEKKYIAKSFFFWMVRFLKLKYNTVDLVFIAHDVEARVVPEKDFFTISNSGGTLCSSAYQVALDHLKKCHPRDNWNNYLFHFSDGENQEEDNSTCKDLIQDLLTHCTMIGYGEINYQDDASFYGLVKPYSPHWSTLYKELKTVDSKRFITTIIKQKEDVHNALQHFFSRKEARRQ